jgi:hypothetical protein
MARNPLQTLTLKSFLLTMLCATISWAGTVTLGNADAASGDTALEVPLHFIAESGEEVAGIQVDIFFDGAALEITAAYDGASAIAADKDVRLNLLDDNTVRIIVAGFNQNVLSDGEVASIEFSISTDAAPGTYPVVLEELLLSDPFGQNISSTAVNGSITVTSGSGGNTEGETATEGEAATEGEEAGSPIGCFAAQADDTQSAAMQPPGWGGALLLMLVVLTHLFGARFQNKRLELAKLSRRTARPKDW